MGKGKLETTRQLQRIVALRYNPFFEEFAKQIRQEYAIPENSTEAQDWFKDLLGRYKKSAFGFFFKSFFEKGTLPFATGAFALGNIGSTYHPWVAPRELNEMNSIIDTEVPFERHILAVLPRFGVPFAMYFVIIRYVLTGNKSWLHPLWLQPEVECEFDLKTGQPWLKVTIPGLGPWTTKKQWDEIWDNNIKLYLKALGEVLGTTQPSRKRATFLSLEKQIKRYAEWYQLSEEQGLGPTPALEMWYNSHPDERDKYDVSAITHAITEFREIITPTAIED